MDGVNLSQHSGGSYGTSSGTAYVEKLSGIKSESRPVNHRNLLFDRVAAEADRLAKLLRQDVCRLVLDVELAAEMERGHALGGRDLLPDRHDDLLERQLAVSEHGPRCHGVLGAAFRLRASKAAMPDAVRLQAAAARAVWLPAVLSPAEVAEQAIIIVIGERPNLLGIEIAAIRVQERMLCEAFPWVRPGATVVFRTSSFEPCGEGVIGVRTQDGNSPLEAYSVSSRYAGHRRTAPSEDGSKKVSGLFDLNMKDAYQALYQASRRHGFRSKVR